MLLLLQTNRELRSAPNPASTGAKRIQMAENPNQIRPSPAATGGVSRPRAVTEITKTRGRSLESP